MSVKRYLLAGGNTGIGLEMAKALLDRGDEVWMLARRMPEVTMKGNLNYHHYDIHSPETLALPDEFHGFAYLPGSINLKPFRALSDNDFRQELEINFLGALPVLRYVLPALKKGKPSSMLFFSSVAVTQGMSFHSSIAAAKGAVEGFVRSMAAELAPDIRVNAIAPSLTRTPLATSLLSTPQKEEAAASRHPLRRIGDPVEMAKLALFLMSEESSFISGQILHADGGLSAVRGL
jgi:NAD(P)-dependent dehydrogenase (short-subunit alcohol dehydrogenase family)